MASTPFMCLIGAWCVVIAKLYWDHRRKERLPQGSKPLPGPKGLPLVGRVHDVPPVMTWLKFHEWSKKYGPIYQMEMFGHVHVWISSEQVVQDLLSRRAAIYSDRPVISNLPDNRTSGDYLALAGNNETWKRQRKLCNQMMATSAKGGLHSYPTRERDRFLQLMALDCGNYVEWIEQFTARTVSRLSWGSPHRQATLRETTFGLLETISPGGSLPNVVSWLGNLPLKLSPWQKREKARHAREKELFVGNVSDVKAAIANNTAAPSFTRTFLEELERNPRGSKAEDDAHVAEAMYVVGQMAIAGALTIGSPIQSFILAMLHYPDWLARLQSEIDMQLGGRCPQWDDREQLPMLRAVVKETLRWRPPVPTGIPHASEKDDVYNGYFIPKGATMHALEWSLTRNEELYPDPEAFNPARWLESSYPTYKEPLTVYPNLAGYSQFGFGRRTCQGVPVVDQDLFLSMGGLAWAFHIRQKLGYDGKPIPVHWNSYSSLLIAKPLRFDFDCVLRDGKGPILDRMASAAREMEEEEARVAASGKGSHGIAAVTASTTGNAPAVEATPAKPRVAIAEKEVGNDEIMSETGTLASGSDSDSDSLRDSMLLSAAASEGGSSVYSSDSDEPRKEKPITGPNLKTATSIMFSQLPGGWKQ
ncbi:hypothetical protein RB595_006926 [Gaeumannomyces hyphopodioides]